MPRVASITLVLYRLPSKLAGVMRAVTLWIACTACSTAKPSTTIDAAPDGEVEVDAPLDAPGAYRHTILIDGSDDFVAAEQFTTTSAAYQARISWDDQHVYLGYSGPDLDPNALDTATKWLFVYIDFDPGAGTGATTSLRYNTQQAVFPTGFGAELYVRWRCDATFASIEQRMPDDTYATIDTPTAAQAGDFVELAIPRVLLGGADAVGLVTWMINEKPLFEGNFAGLYAGNFTDGYSEELPLTRYLRIDFTSPLPPNDPSHAAP
jgi:hypothetical protein